MGGRNLLSRDSRAAYLEGMKKLVVQIAILSAGFATPGLAQVEIPVLPVARNEPTDWSYTEVAPPGDWIDPSVDVSAWQIGKGGFGVDSTPGAVVGTAWTGSEIWIRKTFTLAGLGTLENLAWKIHHDETVEIYLNGVFVHYKSGFTTDYITLPLSDEAKAALKEGENVIAVHCSQTGGGQYIDVGIVSLLTVTLTSVLPDSRLGGQEWQYSLVEPGTSNWMTAGYTAEGWATGQGGFGNVLAGMDSTVLPGTAWTTSDIWLRKTFTLPAKTYTDFFFDIFYDEDVEVFINGTLVLSRKGFLTAFRTEGMAKALNPVLVPGQNLLAVHCRQSAGGQYIDVGISAVEGIPTALDRPGRSGAESGRPGFRRGKGGFQVRAAMVGMAGMAGNAGRATFYDFNGRWAGQPD